MIMNMFWSAEDKVMSDISVVKLALELCFAHNLKGRSININGRNITMFVSKTK